MSNTDPESGKDQKARESGVSDQAENMNGQDGKPGDGRQSGDAPEQKTGQEKPDFSGAQTFPIVGVGCSAGGLAALEGLFKGLPADSRMAFVVIQHLSKNAETSLRHLLSKYTDLQVEMAEDATTIESGRIYVKPPEKDVMIRDRTLVLREPEPGPRRLPIDVFFRSLARDQGNRSIGIVLSGTGQDGTLGIQAIEGAGGMAMAQDEDEAAYLDMPASAINTGQVDYVLPVGRMGEQLARYAAHPYVNGDGGRSRMRRGQEKFESTVLNILAKVRDRTGHDFSNYKRSTILRRIQRRMAVNQMSEIDDYATYIKRNVGEAEQLFRDLLINVTQFFRDPRAWEELAEKALKPLLQSKDASDELRVWVAGCGTGEEAYSVAILLTELMKERGVSLRFKVFGTDINERAIRTARAGAYPASIAQDLSEERLHRFFEETEQGFSVRTDLRDKLIFALHDVTRDPPFSRLDLACCRNLLIYMDVSLQKNVLRVLHYALRGDGYLFLGASEGVGDFTDLFSTVDSKWKIFQARGVESRPARGFRNPNLRRVQGDAALDEDRAAQAQEVRAREGDPAEEASHPTPAPGQPPELSKGFRGVVERTILEQAAPGALVDENFIVRFLHGDTSRYLSMPKGEPSFNILDMARGELGENIREGVGQVKSTGRGVVMEDVRVFKSFDVLIVDLELSPLRGAAKGMGDSLHFLILFREREMESEGGGDSSRVATLEQELQSTRQDLQATIEELETSNEELKSSNEEQQANLEELQSTNEELETSREELQSTNEELEGVNAELQRKNEELRKAKDDIANIFAATEIGTVFLDTDLNVKRFNPAARNIFKLRDEDRGRPLTDIASRIDYEEITDDVSQVLDNLTKKHRDLQAREGEWYRVIIRPYRTSDNVIQGVVLTFADISGLRLARMLAERRADMIQGLLETFTRPVLILDQDTRVDSVNDAFLETMDASREGIEGTMISDLPRPPWDRDRLKELLEDLGENDGVRRAVLPASDGNGKWSVRAWALDKEPKTGPWAVLILYPDQEDAAFDPSENKTP